jgi:NAD+ diphosphatase
MKDFIPAHQLPESYANNSIWFVFQDGLLWVNAKGKGIDTFPTFQVIGARSLNGLQPGIAGQFKGRDCYYMVVDHWHNAPRGFEFVNIRSLYDVTGAGLFQLTGHVQQIAHWDQSNRFCGRCGHAMDQKQDERAKHCSHCHLVVYPRISPAVIVAITRGDQILLASNARFKGHIHSILAGFVEVGESLEECIHREIMEEANIEVGDLRYFDSQPWPFPDSLMIGFFAKYKSGELKIDGKELTTAGWYSKDNLPELPLPFSIARRMIDYWLEVER